MIAGIASYVLPASQRRSLEDLTDQLDLTEGDAKAKQSAFWIMLTLSAFIAVAGVLADSTATVIGAMIVAPLSTPIMGLALSLVKQESLKSVRFIVAGAALVISIGVLFALLLPSAADITTNSQVTGRTSPGLLDLIAALATGIAGAVGIARKDVASIMPGVAIAISLVPPLGVVGVCLGEGRPLMALGALLLFLSNLVAMVLAGTIVYTGLAFRDPASSIFGEELETERRAERQRRPWAKLTGFAALVFIPLIVNTVVVTAMHQYRSAVKNVAEQWVSPIDGATVTGVTSAVNRFTISVETPTEPPPVDQLRASLRGKIPDWITISVQTTQGKTTDLGRVN